MDLSGIPTPHMDWESTNLTVSWKKFKQHCELIFAGPLKQKSEEVKVTYLLLWIGDTGRDIFNTWTIPDDEAKRLNALFKRYARHVQPKRNPVFARIRFNDEVQGSNTVDQFITKLKFLSIDCQFMTLRT